MYYILVILSSKRLLKNMEYNSNYKFSYVHSKELNTIP